MSIKWMVIFLALFVLVSIGAGFIKGAIQQRKINKEAAKNAPPVEKLAGKPAAKSVEKSAKKDSDEKSLNQKPAKKPKKKPEVKKPKRLS